MTAEQQHQLRAIKGELEALASYSGKIEGTAEGKTRLAEVVVRGRTLNDAMAETLGGAPELDEFTRHLADVQMLVDHWDELLPVWKAHEQLGKLLETLPRAPESIPMLLTAARELQAALLLKRDVLPVSYLQPQLDELNRLQAMASAPSAD